MPTIDIKELEGPLKKFKDEIEVAVSEKLSASEGVVTDEIKLLQEHNVSVKTQIDSIIKSIEERAKLQVPGLDDDLKKKKFSFNKMSNAMFREVKDKDYKTAWNKAEAGFEKEVIDTYMEKLSKGQIAGDGSQGGYLVPTEVTNEFINLVMAMTPIINELDPMIFDGLRGDLPIPKHTARGSAIWLGETEPVTESENAFGEIWLRPKKLASFTKSSRRLAYQTGNRIENFIRTSMAETMALAMHLAYLHGTGSDGMPLGIFSHPDIPWSNVRAATSSSRFLIDNAASMAQQLDVADELKDSGSFGYLFRPEALGGMKRERVAQYSAQPLGEAMPLTANFILQSKKQLEEALGYKMSTTTQILKNVTKATTSSTTSSYGVFGNWQQFYIGMWRGLEFRISEHASDESGKSAFLRDQFFIQALQETDSNVGRETAFVKTDDIETLESKW